MLFRSPFAAAAAEARVGAESSVEEAREKVLLREEDRSRYLDWYANGLLRALGLAAGSVGFAC